MSTGKQPIARRVLITNFVLDHGTGTEAYLRDLAVRLIELDRLPMVYTPRPGTFARRLIADGIPVIDDLAKLSIKPDIIHGHHTLETAAAAMRFSDVPVISFCHDAEAWHDTPLDLPNVVHYVAVDQACHDRLVIQGGISPEKVSRIANGVNLDRFPLREHFAESPRSVLCFANGFTEQHLAMVRSALPDAHVEGLGLGLNRYTSDPGSVLPHFDMVLARGRCAREAIASGAATICASYNALGEMVTPDNYAFLERNNFGRRVLTKAFTAENLRRAFECYSASATREVALRHRRQVDLASIAAQLTDLYDREVARFTEHENAPADSLAAVSKLLAWASVHANVVHPVAAPQETPVTLPPPLPAVEEYAEAEPRKEEPSGEVLDLSTIPFAKPKRSVPQRIARECQRVVRRTLGEG